MVDVYFATNRNPIGDPPKDFGKKLGPVDGTALRFGRAAVNLKKQKITKLEVFSETLVSNTSDPTSADLQFGSDTTFGVLRQKMAKHGRDTLVYVHGFANPFVDTVLRAAEIKSFYKNNLNVVLFSWPSDGQLLLYDPYFRDRADAESSGEALARGILFLARFLRDLPNQEYCEQRVHMMAHSMGNYALRHGMRALQNRIEGRHWKIFSKVFLMAADDDDDTLKAENKMAFLTKIADEIAVYYTPRDKALDIADITKGRPERLGSEGPVNARELPDKVTAVNVSDVLYADDDVTNHQYYRINPLVRKDVLAVLEDTPSMDIPGRRHDPHGNRFWLKREAH